MRFYIGDDLLDRAPDFIVAFVAAELAQAPGAEAAARAARLLDDAVAALRARQAEARRARVDVAPAELVRTDPMIVPWRDAFTLLGINPNRFPSSIEAMALRVAKGDRPPSVNPVVDLANSVALRHVVPAGAHDLDTVRGDLGVRLSRSGERFAAGDSEFEEVPAGEPVYADDRSVRTRRWVWRQSADGRISAGTRRLFFPVDGFAGRTGRAVEAAAEELAAHLEMLAPIRLEVGQVDSRHRFREILG